jgi:hypothetical protein
MGPKNRYRHREDGSKCCVTIIAMCTGGGGRTEALSHIIIVLLPNNGCWKENGS